MTMKDAEKKVIAKKTLGKGWFDIEVIDPFIVNMLNFFLFLSL